MKTRTSLLLLALVASTFVVPRTVRAIGNDNPTGPTGSHNGEITTAGSYDAYTGNAKRAIDDLVVAGAVGAYPLKWTRVLNTRYTSNVGFGSGGWDYSFNWRGWVQLPTPPGPCYGDCTEYEGPDAKLEYPDGRAVDFYQDGANPNVYRSWLGTEPGDRLVRDLSDNGWNLKLKDGGAVHFAPTSNIGYVTLLAQKITDPYGQTLTFQRDGSGRLWRVVEPGGRFLQINYVQLWLRVGENGFYGDFIESVQAFASASASATETVTYHYTHSPGVYSRYFLTRVDYADGGQAHYSYQAVNAGGSSAGHQLIKTCSDVRYAGPMKQIEYQFEQAGASFNVAYGQVKAEKNVLGQIVSQVQYPVFPQHYVPQPGNTALQTRVETRGDGRSRTFLYGTGVPGQPPEGTWTGVLNTYTDFKNQQSELTRMTYGDSPPDIPGGGLRTTIKAPLNRTTYVDHYYQTNVVKKVTHPNGDYTFFTYENDTGLDPAPVYLASRRDENGRITYFARDPATRAVRKIGYGCDPNGPSGVCPTEEFTYNQFGQVQTHKLTTGGTEYFYYDEGLPPRGLKTRHVDAMGNPTRYQYYTSGPNTDRLWKVTDPREKTTTFEYNLRGQVTKVIHPYPDNSYTQSFYNLDGTLAWSADENHPGAASDENQRTRYTYDEYKRVLTVTNPMNQTTTNSYGLNPVTWGDPLLHTTNNVKYTLSPMNKNVVYDYDENLRKVGQNVAYGSPDYAHTGFEYDPFGNVLKTTDPRWKETTFGYDSRDRQIWMKNPIATDRNSNGHTMDWVYDGVGNKIKETRADNAFRSWEYETTNPMNRLTKTIDWRMSPAEPAVATVYGRNVFSTEETITDAKGAVYTFGFDYLHRKTSATYPMDATGSVRTETWEYDPAGNLKLYKNPAGQYKHLDFADSYDSRNRLRRSAWNIDPGNNAPNHAVGPETTTVYDAASRMTSITTNSGETTVSFAYDDANRLLYEDQTVVNGGTRRVQHDRDADGNATNTHIPGWYLLWHGYNQRNQLAQIQDGGGTPWINFSYDAAGNMTKRQAVYGGVNDSLNVPTEYYDGLNRPTVWENSGAGDVAFARSRQQYDSAGRMTATWRDEQASKGERFTYNVRNQVTNSVFDADYVWTGNPQNPQRTVSYDVDPLNRQSVSDSAEPKPNGLSATYYSNDNFTGSTVLRNDPVVNFNWNGAMPFPTIPAEGFSVRWEGQVVPRYSQTYTFYTQSDDGVRLWVNGQLLIDNWTYHAWTENSGTITLVAGQRYSIRMDYFQGSSGAIAALLWSSPSQGKEVIPSSQLYAARPANGLQATYYDNIDFSGTKVLRTDPAISFDWGGGSPEPTMGVDGFSVRWEGQIVPRFSETYTFYAGSDDGVRLWINGQLIVDNWWDRGHTEGTGTIDLVLGQAYHIRMDYYENGGGASASLAWSSGRQPKEIVPSSQLFVPSTSGNYWSNALNQYTRAGGQTVEYDAGFNLKSYAGATFTYNAQNQLIKGTKGTNTVQFVYDGLGRCLKRTTNGGSIIFAYDGWKPLAEFAESYWRFRIYGAGPDEILWHYDSRVGYIRVHSDVHGSVMALLDTNGAGMEKYTYDAFGKPKITDWYGNERPVSNFGNRFMYTGRDWIEELGIYDYRNRMYLPELGRFLQVDPIGFDAGDMNLFRYCGDDPVDRTDPLGLEGEKFGPGQQELAVDVARSQIEAANADPGRKLVSERITQKGGYQKTIRYYPSKMVPVFHHGKGYQLGKIVDGRPYTVNGVTFELEFVKESGRRVAVLVHGHNDVKGGKKGDRPGIAQAGWSSYDEAVRNIDRLDESRPGVWHSRRNGKEVPSDRASREKASRGVGGNSSKAVSGSSTDAVSSGPTARDIDFAHQSTGVPSLGAEAVNFAPGKP